MLKILLQQFIQRTGRNPNAIEMLQLKFKAAGQAGKGKVIQFPKDRITDFKTPGPTSELQSGIMKATGSKPTAVKTEAQIKAEIEAGNKAAVQKIKIDKLKKDVLKEIENRKNEDYIGNIIDPEDYGFKVSDNTLTDEVEEILQMLRDEKAYGGVAGMLGERTGFKLGGIDKARRLFLQAIGAGAATVGAAKTGLFGLLKGAGKKNLIQVPIKEGADGMPSWFKPLVNKVIKEGTEVESGAERVIVHKTKLPESKTDVYVQQDLSTGDVVVDIGTGKHGFADGYYGQPVRLEYKASELIEPDLKTGKGGGKTKEEFNVEEAEFTGGHPENVKFEESTVEKYGNHGSDFSEIERFATGKNVTKDKSGKFKEVETLPTTKKADRLEYEQGKAEADADAAADMADDFASGGRAGYVLGGKVAAGILSLLKNPKKIKAAIDNIFPTGDYKYDAQMAAESLVELNPKAFGNKLYDDLDQATQIKIYGAVIDPVQQNALMASRMKKASKPTKTLEGIEKTGTINISDPNVAEEFARFMKETNPEGSKTIEQTVELMNFNPKGRKKNASGGIARMLGE